MELFQEYLGGGGKKQQKIFGSSLEDIKQKAIKAGINPVNLQQAQQFQDGSWTPFAQGTTATYKGSEGIAEQSFTGTKQEITQQATDAGINPSNLFSGIDKFVPEADDNIDISQGEASVLQGSQSGWFKKFQNAYVSGQATLQNSIDMAMNRLMEITEEEKQARESQISDIKGDLDEAKASSSGQELYYNLAEKEDLKGKRDELLKLKNKMAMLNNAYEESIMETEGSGITIGQSRGELARKQRSYASRATMIQAQASMLSDDLDTSMELIKLWYDDATEERVAEISRYSDLLDVAEKAKLNLSNQDRTDVANLISTLTGEQAKQDDNKDKIMALAVDPNTAEAFFSSGASLDDTYETILEKMSPYMSSYAKQRRLKALNEGGMSVEEILEKQRIEESMIGLSWEIIGVKKQIQDEESKRNPDEDKLKILRSKENTLYSRVSTGDRLELNQKIKDISSNYTEVLGAARQLVEEEGLEPAVNIISADETLDVTTRQNIINKIQSEKAKPKIGIGGIIKTIFTTGLFSPTKYLFKK